MVSLSTRMATAMRRLVEYEFNGAKACGDEAAERVAKILDSYAAGGDVASPELFDRIIMQTICTDSGLEEFREIRAAVAEAGDSVKPLLEIYDEIEATILVYRQRNNV